VSPQRSPGNISNIREYRQQFYAFLFADLFSTTEAVSPEGLALVVNNVVPGRVVLNQHSIDVADTKMITRITVCVLGSEDVVAYFDGVFHFT
jgi:hypothetical protein